MSLMPSGPASLDRIRKIRAAPIFLTCHTLRHWKSKEQVTSSPSSYVSGCSSTSVLPLSVLTQHQRAPPAQEQSTQMGPHAGGTTGSSLVLSLLYGWGHDRDRSGEKIQPSSCLDGRAKYSPTDPPAVLPEPPYPSPTRQWGEVITTMPAITEHMRLQQSRKKLISHTPAPSGPGARP